MSTFAVVCVIAVVVTLLAVFGLGVRVGFRAGAALPGSTPQGRVYPGRVARVDRPGAEVGVLPGDARPRGIGGPGKDPTPEKDLTWLPTAVYTYWDRGGNVLYVGIAANPGKRAKQHAGLATEAMKPWWPQVDARRTKAFWMPNRIAACCVEWALIYFLQPPWNTAPGSSDDAYCLDQPPIRPAVFEVPATGLTSRVYRAARR